MLMSVDFNGAPLSSLKLVGTRQSFYSPQELSGFQWKATELCGLKAWRHIELAKPFMNKWLIDSSGRII